MERQIDRIREAEKAMGELVDVAAQLRRQIESAAAENREQLRELIQAAERFEGEVQRMKESLQKWRQGIQ